MLLLSSCPIIISANGCASGSAIAPRISADESRLLGRGRQANGPAGGSAIAPHISADESRLLGRRMHATGWCKGSANGAAQEHRQWSVHEHAYEFGLLATQQVDQIYEYTHGHPNSTPKARIRAM